MIYDNPHTLKRRNFYFIIFWVICGFFFSTRHKTVIENKVNNGPKHRAQLEKRCLTDRGENAL